MINIKNTMLYNYTDKMIEMDFGSVDEFEKLDIKAKTVILQLYHERMMDNNKTYFNGYDRLFNTTTESSYLINTMPLYNILEDNIHQMSKYKNSIDKLLKLM